MIQSKAYKFKFYPNPKQRQVLAKTFGCARFVYNTLLHYRSTSYKNGTSINFYQASKHLTSIKKEFTFLKEVSSVPLQQAGRNLQSAYSRFFKKQARYPKFKKKSNRQSATFTKNSFSWNNHKLSVSKGLGKLKIKFSRKVRVHPDSITISKEPSGKYFVSFKLKEDIEPLSKVDKKIGIDLGIKTLAVTSDGVKTLNPKSFDRYKKQLAFLQKSLSRKKKGSSNREKARLKVAKCHSRIASLRRDYINKFTTQIVRENQVICIENLNVAGMIRNRKLARHIADASWGEISRQFKYKCEWYGRKLVKIDRFYPSSRLCNGCKFKNVNLKLSDRVWKCSNCNDINDRDLNAAKNILEAGLVSCGETVRPSRVSTRRVLLKQEPPIKLGTAKRLAGIPVL